MKLIKALAILDALGVDYEIKTTGDKVILELVEDGNLWEAKVRKPQLIKKVTETEYFAEKHTI